MTRRSILLLCVLAIALLAAVAYSFYGGSIEGRYLPSHLMLLDDSEQRLVIKNDIAIIQRLSNGVVISEEVIGSIERVGWNSFLIHCQGAPILVHGGLLGLSVDAAQAASLGYRKPAIGVEFVRIWW